MMPHLLLVFHAAPQIMNLALVYRLSDITNASSIDRTLSLVVEAQDKGCLPESANKCGCPCA